jgi:hypothetical protein
LRVLFDDVGYEIPYQLRASIGFPKQRLPGCKIDGQCWAPDVSSDRHFELFVSPTLKNSVQILAVLAHECVHAAVGLEAGHGRTFKRCALRIGLAGPMRSTVAGPAFVTWAEMLFDRIGGYLVETPKQATRQLRCECAVCGYIARVSRKWLVEAGPPICPTDQVAMPETAVEAPVE